MTRVGRQPIWWIITAVMLFLSYALSVVASLADAPSASLLADMTVTMCVATGTACFAFGYRIGSRYIWWALATIYLAANGPFLLGILFRLARATANPSYQLRSSVTYYGFMIFMITFWVAATLRIVQSFRAHQQAEASRLREIFSDG